MKFLIFALAGITFFSSCQEGSSSSGECKVNCLGDGVVHAVVNGRLELTFENALQGQVFAVIPFVLGNPDDVDGATAETISSVKVEVSEASTTSNLTSRSWKTASTANPFTSMGFKSSGTRFDWYHRDHQLRTIWNHLRVPLVDQKNVTFNDRSSPHQGHHLLTSSYSSEPVVVDSAFYQLLNTVPEHKQGFIDYIAQLQQVRSKQTFQSKKATAALGGACPSEVYVPVNSSPIDSSKVWVEWIEKPEFCIAMIDENPVTVSDVTAIEDSLAKALGLYRMIYNDEFQDEPDGYPFKPLLVIMPFDNEDYWPASLEAITGVFIPELSELNNRPTLYVPSDIKAVNPSLDDETAQTIFHATIAHELQHAIINYYRFWVQGHEGETIALDEGIAHFMEDLLGYGDLTFQGFVLPYLQFFVGDPRPPLLVSQELPALYRGGAQSLIYYLVSQAGGVSYLDGTVDTNTASSPGLELIRNFVKNDLPGVAGLKQALEQDWLEAIGGFYGALVVDGAKNFVPKPLFTTQALVAGVQDTSGENDKVFGMNFNHFSDVSDVWNRLADYPSWRDFTEQKPLQFYQPRPFRFTIGSSESSLALEFDPNHDYSGATVVRVR